MKRHPSEIGLSLTAEVLRLPIEPGARLVLAEIISLHAANGCCDCSDMHFVARLSISRNTAGRHVQQLKAAGLIDAPVNKAAGNYRRLIPQPAAIVALATSNPYPQNGGSPTPKMGEGYPQNEETPTPNVGGAYPQDGGSPTPNVGEALPPKWGINTPDNIPENFQQDSTTPPPPAADAAAGGPQKKIDEASPTLSLSPTAPTPPVAAAPPPPKPGKAKPERPVLMRDSPLAAFPAFVDAWQVATDANPDTYAAYAEADLLHYHTALLDWSEGGRKTKHDWLATIRASMRRDADNGRLRLLPSALSPNPSATSHDRPHASSFQRPVNGAKPSGNAGQLARALSRQLRESE